MAIMIHLKFKKEDLTKSNDPNQDKQNIFKEESISEEENETTQQTASGLDENVAGMLTYPLGALTGIIFLLIEKDNNFVKFHAIQSIIFSIAYFIITFIITLVPLIGLIVTILSTPLYIAFIVFLAYKAYKHEMFEIPIIGEFAKKQIS